MPYLKLIKSPGGGERNQSYPLAAAVTVLGRDDACDIVVPNTAVSRKHAQITLGPDQQYYIEDLNSRNGTTVNTEPLSQIRLLKNQDRIKICDFIYLFEDDRANFAPPEQRNFSSLPSEELSQSNIEHSLSTRISDRFLDTQPTEKLRALLDISTALSRTFDLGVLLETIAEKVLEVFRQADRCFVITRHDDGELIPRIVKVRRAGGADDQHRFSKTIIRRAIETTEAYLSEDASSDTNLNAAMSVAGFNIRSVMCVPLTIPDGAPIGALQVDTLDRTKKFRAQDLELLAIVANLAAVALDKARLHTQAIERQKQQNEIELARRVQLDLLPQSQPPLPGYEFFHHYSAALTVGGDYYDFIPMANGHLAVLLGDVAGKGVPASLLMAKLSAEARYCLLTQPDLSSAIQMLNEQLIRGGIGDRFVTLAALIIDPCTHQTTIVNAGHIKPILFRQGQLLDTIDTEHSGLPLGIAPGFTYTSVACTLEPGDTLLIFSDGVTDAMDPHGITFDLEGVRRTLQGQTELSRPAMVGERLMKAVKTHAAGRSQNDDIAFVCFGRLVDCQPSSSKDTDSHVPRVSAE